MQSSRLLALLAPAFACSLAVGQCIEEGPEPNDFSGTPTFMAVGSRASCVLAGGDVDYFQVAVAVPGVLKAYTSYGRGNIATVDTIVEIRDSLDTLLSEDDDGGLGVFSYTGCNITAPGIYYVAVRGFATTSSGAYTLDLLFEAGPVLAEGPEPNNGPLVGGVPSTAACGLVHAGEISVGDDDWWSFTHPGGDLSLTVGPGGPSVAPSGVGLFDSIVELYSSTSALLGSDDDGGEAFYSALGVPALAPGQYFARVYHFDPLESGYYTLRIGCGNLTVTANVTPAIGTQPGCVSGCGTGTPTLSVRSSNTSNTGTRARPRIGTTFSLDVSNLPPLSIAIHITGLTLFPALDLGPLGAPGCFVGPALDLTTVAFSDAAGQSKLDLALPNNASLNGITVNWQTASLSACHNAFGIATSNTITGLIGDVAFL